MRIWQGVFLGALLVPLLLGGVSNVDATSLTGRSSTVLKWYENQNDDAVVPIYQYLQLNANDIGDSGYSFKFYGRLADDANDNSEVDIDNRLYYAYLEKKDLFKGFDFRLGRQFISTTAGATMMDGLNLDYAITPNYKARAFVGGDVKYYEGYNLKDAIGGVEFTASLLDESIDLGVSYLQRRDGGYLSEEYFGFNLDYDIKGRAWLYNELQWDNISERLSYALVGGKVRVGSQLTLRAEYLYSLPVFSSTSIYSVFAVEEYEEAMLEAVYKFRRDLQMFVRYTRELYDEFDDADVFELGFEKLRTGSFSGYLSGVYRIDDDGEDLYGAKIYADYKITETLRAGVGGNVDVLERDIAYFSTDDNDQNETTSTRLWADAKFDITDKVALKGKYEYIESDLRDYDNRGTVRLNILF